MAYQFSAKLKYGIDSFYNALDEQWELLAEPIDCTLEIFSDYPDPISNNLPILDTMSLTITNNVTGEIFDALETGGSVVWRKRT